MMGDNMAKEREEAILKFWQEQKIFEKTLDKDAPNGEFVFYDGPPFATGLPHFGHLLPTTLKDLIPRYKTMRGYRVRRRWGWDCHGLPIENLIEKELGLKSKKDIEDYGIGKFNQKAKESVLRYAGEWCSIVPRVGRWVDMANDYRTMDSSYTESVWWVFKTLHDKGLVYEGFKSMHVCPRCETTLSNFEVNLGYKDITDISVYVECELSDEPNTFLIAWTTTPWTLPGNVALAINPEIDYVEVEGEVHGNKYIVAKNTVEKAFVKDFRILRTFKGADLVGKSYKPVFEYYVNNSEIKNKENAWKIYAADFVDAESGTGVVHIAPAFGNDDYNLSLKENLPFIQHVSKDGCMKPEVADFAGLYVKPKSDEKDGHQKTDIEIIKWLARENKLFKKEKIVHTYPHCWRCDTPLLNYATSSWFVKVTAIKDKMIEQNKSVRWIPEAIGENRFGRWLEGSPDWNVSRQRFWGAPIPVWKCNECKKTEIVGSLSDIKSRIKPRNKYFVMRHGEGEHNILNVTSSDIAKSYHLTDKGREEVALVAHTLRDQNIDMVYVSPLARTIETAEIVQENIGFAGEVVVDERLREYGFGDFDGQDIEEYHRYFNSVKEQLQKRTPGGENIKDVAKRVGEFIYDIDAKHSGKNILIVTHDAPASMIFAVTLGGHDRDLVNLWAGDFLQTGHLKPLEFIPLPHNDEYELDFHRPHIDQVELACGCGGQMRRVPDVFDCWFESGSMPYAEIHYPFAHHDEFRQKHFPADFIAEGLDQTRGWFYTMLILGTALFGESPYRNVIVNGLILAEDGQKMSKSKNNFPPIMPTIEKYGADAVRFFLMQSPSVKAEDVCFSEKGVDEINKKVIMRLDNVATFFELYATNLTTFNFSLSTNILDKWIVARVSESGISITESLDKYEIDRAMRPIVSLIDDLSTWYLRRSRDRFKSDDVVERNDAIATTHWALIEISKLIAPVMPFYAEYLYKKIAGPNGKESVHLESWPEYSEVDLEVINNMKLVRSMVELGLASRNNSKIKVRQPLASFTFATEAKLAPEYLNIIADELNVKMVKVGEKDELDTNITSELKMEGDMRELVRMIQDKRKEENWNVGDKGTLTITTNADSLEMIKVFESEIKKIAGMDSIDASEGELRIEIKKR